MNIIPVIANAVKQSSLRITASGLPSRLAPRNDGIVMALLMVILCAQPANAQQRQRDFSMPLEESLRRGDSPVVSTPLNTTNQNSFAQPQQQTPRGSYNNYAGPNNSIYGRTDFMTSYCDPNFAMGTLNRNAQACLEARKREHCAAYEQQKREVQQVVSSAVDCRYNASERVRDTNQDECAYTDTQRIQLLKRYAEDVQAIRALIFLPEDILEAGNSCVTGRQ